MDTIDCNYSKALVIPSILVVEDERALRLLMRTQLEQFGFKVDQADDGIAAVRQFENNRYCLIFMDIQMPHMNGLQTTAVIRSHEKQLCRKPTPIIATTAGGANRELCLIVGMSDYLEKPVDMKKLERVLEKWKCNSGCADLVI
jgi:CheY-like chemotaxis protein